jgi:hypothetical protein
VTTILAGVSLAAAALMVVAAVRLARDGWTWMTLVLPAVAVLTILVGVVGAWSRPAYALPVLLAVTAVELAYLGGDGAAAWNTLVVFVVGGVMTGYGLLGSALCDDETVPCSRPGVAHTASGVGAAIALVAYLLLLVRVRRVQGRPR